MPSLNKRSIEAVDECVTVFKKLRESSDDAAALCVVGKIFHTKLFPTASTAALHTINNHYVKLRKELSSEFPDLRGSNILPKMPQDLAKSRKDMEIQTVNSHIENPIKINADLMLSKALRGLKEGLADKIYPEVKLCMSFLCCIRSNDLNPKFVRGNGQTPQIGVTHEWLDDYDGSFIMLPSKQKDGTNYKAFSNVTIVKQEFYPIVKEAFEFLLDHANAKKHCYCSVKEYLARTECGATSSSCEWSDRVTKKMIERLGFKEAVLEWNGWEEKEFINETFARRFVACCIHKEIIRFDNNLNVGMLAADICLGHVVGSTATRTYLRYNVRPTQVEGVILKKVEKPIKWAEGKEISTGLYLQQT